MLTVVRRSDTGIGLNVLSEDFLFLGGRMSKKTLKASLLHTPNLEVASIDEITPFSVSLGDLRVRLSFEVFENSSVECCTGRHSSIAVSSEYSNASKRSSRGHFDHCRLYRRRKQSMRYAPKPKIWRTYKCWPHHFDRGIFLCHVVRPVTAPSFAGSYKGPFQWCRGHGDCSPSKYHYTSVLHDCPKPRGHLTRKTILCLDLLPDCKAAEFAKIHECHIRVICSFMHHTGTWWRSLYDENEGQASTQCDSDNLVHTVYY